MCCETEEIFCDDCTKSECDGCDGIDEPENADGMYFPVDSAGSLTHEKM